MLTTSGLLPRAASAPAFPRYCEGQVSHSTVMRVSSRSLSDADARIAARDPSPETKVAWKERVIKKDLEALLQAKKRFRGSFLQAKKEFRPVSALREDLIVDEVGIGMSCAPANKRSSNPLLFRRSHLYV